MTRLCAAIPCALAFALAPAFASRASAQLLRRPVTCDTCISDFYYKDQGQFAPTDWDCGDSTYDGHLGSDYSLRNGNFAIDNDNEVVAMAAGMVVASEDGYYDRCTQCGGQNCGTGIGNGFANQVVIEDGTHRVIYGHMKMGSIAVQTGDMVACGQVIGFIGSSGCSTGAHLHVEPRPPGGGGLNAAIDPYEGECSPTTESLWVSQGAYRTLPGIACDDEPPVPMCPADTYPIWTCNEAQTARRRCMAGMDMLEECMWGCTSMPVGTDDVCAMPPDADGDGSRADVDCADTDRARHPGAVEVCGDGVDQDCSGADQPCPPGAGAGGAMAGGGSGAGGIPGAVQPPGGAAGAAGIGPAAGQFAPTSLGQGGAAPLAGATAGAWPAAARAPAAEGCSAAGRPAGAASTMAFGLVPIALVIARLRRAARSRLRA